MDGGISTDDGGGSEERVIRFGGERRCRAEEEEAGVRVERHLVGFRGWIGSMIPRRRRRRRRMRERGEMEKLFME